MSEVCRINIGPRQRAARRRWGLTWTILSVAIAVALFASGAPSLFRVGLFFPVVLAAFGWFQSYEKT